MFYRRNADAKLQRLKRKANLTIHSSKDEYIRELERALQGSISSKSEKRDLREEIYENLSDTALNTVLSLIETEYLSDVDQVYGFLDNISTNLAEAIAPHVYVRRGFASLEVTVFNRASKKLEEDPLFIEFSKYY